MQEIHPDSRAKAHHILTETEQECFKLIPQIHSLEDFEKLASQHSICFTHKIQGQLGLTKPGVLVTEIEQAIFNGPMDEVIGPIKTVHGYHLLWVKKRHLGEWTN